MPLVSSVISDPTTDMRQSDRALAIRNGVVRGLSRYNWCFLPEMTLSNGRRADLVCLDEKGLIRIIEIKSSIEDFRVDQKWHEYKDFCDAFYFATLPDVPADIFPQSEGFVLADRHGCEIIREAAIDKLAATTRKALTLRFARAAAERMTRITLQESREIQPVESLNNS